MKVKKANAGALTNLEVLNFLRARGASTDPTRVIAPVSPSEYQVYDYLVETAACNQTQENINEFLKSCEKYKLAKAEKLNIINIRPSTQVEIDPIIEECQNRLKDEQVEELVELIANLFPPPPKPEGADEGEVGISDVLPMEEGTDNVEGAPDEAKEVADGSDEDEEGFSDGFQPEDTDEDIEGTTDGLTLDDTDKGK
ncbi:hypothetical protein C5167_043335 [Papaver somniferum]|uniref:DNA-directed RNA polymerase III subunit RPC9 n=1 Tax=Papaver somniferum TaxID=3469 RepID=A0A4Y7L5E0_PAPSO|nr:DNA-directed RNA polymerase III subunit rpc9-like [Papaver somniferum]XP_026422919.1 DNA-directed RNA polymerase III subunit rpc9-like [Papaver somniferum]XP_026422920.1 DNA-directed RNA polymerase III subunit rpc9-like [Papaver somniferum]RZC80754.1 hypothetical protein C5167_043335 [Papaver somniferum]